MIIWSSYSCFRGAGCSWSWPVCAPVQREEFLCDAEACGSPGPEVEGNVVCNRARQRRDPAENPLTHLREEGHNAHSVTSQLHIFVYLHLLQIIFKDSNNFGVYKRKKLIQEIPKKQKLLYFSRYILRWDVPYLCCASWMTKETALSGLHRNGSF